jgi:hypothetical protein
MPRHKNTWMTIVVIFVFLQFYSCRIRDQKPLVASTSDSTKEKKFKYATLNEAREKNQNKEPLNKEVMFGFLLTDKKQNSIGHLKKLRSESKFIKLSDDEVRERVAYHIPIDRDEYILSIDDSTRLFLKVELGFSNDRLNYLGLTTTSFSSKGCRQDFASLLSFWKNKFGDADFYEKDDIGRDCYYWYDGYKEICVLYNNLYGEYSRIEYFDIKSLAEQREKNLAQDKFKRDSELRQRNIEVEKSKADIK